MPASVSVRSSSLFSSRIDKSKERTKMSDYRCLIVNDSPMMRQLLVFALARVKNLSVTQADDGVDGLRKLAGSKFDVIITDINMPIMDGLKLVKRVRFDPVHKN